MNNPPHLPEDAESAAPGAAVPNPTPLTPGVQETPADPASEFGLTPAQVIAYQAFADGQTSQVAAERAGVDIFTVWHWRSSDPCFMAAMDAWRRRTLANMRGKLQEIYRIAYAQVGQEYERRRAQKKRRASRKNV